MQPHCSLRVLNKRNMSNKYLLAMYVISSENIKLEISLKTRSRASGMRNQATTSILNCGLKSWKMI